MKVLMHEVIDSWAAATAYGSAICQKSMTDYIDLSWNSKTDQVLFSYFLFIYLFFQLNFFICSVSFCLKLLAKEKQHIIFQTPPLLLELSFSFSSLIVHDQS